MNARSARRMSGALLALVASSQLACSRGPTARPVLKEVAAPADLATLDRPVAEQYRALRDRLDRLRKDPAAKPHQLGWAYGKLGHWCSVNEHRDLAEIYYRHAEAVDPQTFAWPYFLGYLYKGRGNIELARQAFERALKIRPQDVPAMVWLAELELDGSHVDRADQLYQQALALDPQCTMAQVGLGKVALNRRDFKAAAQHLEAALVQQPRASTIQYHLGMAYRGLGDSASAQNLLARVPEDPNRRTPVLLQDPLLGQLEQFRLGARHYRDRAEGELMGGNYAGALADCRQALAISPKEPANYFLLARIQLRMNQLDSAANTLRQAVRVVPENVTAHGLLGNVLTSMGRFSEAESEIQTALRLDPQAAESHYFLGNLRRGQGRCGAALPAYAKAVELEESNYQARFWSAVCLVVMQDYRKADQALLEQAQRYPKVTEFAMLRSRVLAGASAAELRDGQKALQLAREAYAAHPTLNNAESVAMAYAELGQYPTAVAWQRAALVGAQIAGLTDAVPRLQERLRLYQQGKPCRQPWLADEKPSELEIEAPIG